MFGNCRITTVLNMRIATGLYNHRNFLYDINNPSIEIFVISFAITIILPYEIIFENTMNCILKIYIQFYLLMLPRAYTMQTWSGSRKSCRFDLIKV